MHMHATKQHCSPFHFLPTRADASAPPHATEALTSHGSVCVMCSALAISGNGSGDRKAARVSDCDTVMCVRVITEKLRGGA